MNAITNTESPIKPTFSSYQKFVVGILAFLQFTIILDFMIISPLGAIVMPALHISTHEFGLAVSSYAFSAAISGVGAAGFADRFDRKRLLLFFYGGFILGTALCAVAPTYHFLLVARVVTGLFGGVIASVVFAISADLFPLEMRGRVMGIVQTAFAGAQVLGLPAGVYLAGLWNWHSAFIAITAIAVPASLVIALYMKPIVGHLEAKQEHSAWQHLARTILEPKYMPAYVGIMALTTGGYMIMPFLSTFIVNNLGIPLRDLPTIYLVTGLCTVFVGPLVGKASDRFGKFITFLFGTLVTLIMLAIYTNLGPSSLGTVIVVNGLLFVGIFSRMIPAQALFTAVPEPTKRGSFNAVMASLQQFSGGIASVFAGLIIVQNSAGQLQHFNWMGYIVMATALLSLALIYHIHRAVTERLAQARHLREANQ
jgi:predicted MFS family arabinose efflux permease